MIFVFLDSNPRFINFCYAFLWVIALNEASDFSIKNVQLTWIIIMLLLYFDLNSHEWFYLDDNVSGVLHLLLQENSVYLTLIIITCMGKK